MKVFVSHQQADSPLAASINRRLTLIHRVDTYLDVIDPNTGQAGDDLGEYIRTVMGSCTHLLAIVSDATQSSWWVPWEIGVATEKFFPISTFSGGRTELPSYLKKWPFLRTDAQLDLYVTEAKRAEGMYGAQRGLPSGREARRAEATQFHRSLKSALGQR